MSTVLRISGFEFRIYPNDHRPAHVHVFRGDDVIVIDVSGGQPKQREVHGMKRNDARRALQIAKGNLRALQEEWRRMHGPRLR